MVLEGMINLESTLFLEIGLIIILATFLAFIAKTIKQPLIPAYILAGMVLGPVGLGLISDREAIQALSEIGIAFLLFIVGLEIDLKKLKAVSLVSTFGGIIQVFLTFGFGFVTSTLLGFNTLISVYIGMIVAFSSTMVVVKLLSDKDELDTLHGRIVLGILIIQDLLVIVALAILTTFDNFSYNFLLLSLLKGVLLMVVAWLISRHVLPHVLKSAASMKELFFLVAISICFSFAVLAHILHFSIVIGAFIAGVGLATSHYNLDIIGKVMSLKDFFATIFFISLGMQLVMISKELLIPLAVLIFFVVFAKPFIIMVLTSIFGYERRTSFLSGFSLGQVSEFGLVMVMLGLALGHISQEFFSMIVWLAIITITLTSYFIKHDEFFYKHFSGPVKYLEKLSMDKKKFEYMSTRTKGDIILFGCHRMGKIFLEDLRKAKKKMLIIDFNPEIIHELMRRKISCLYGDISNVEILERANIEKAKVIISTVPSEYDNIFLIKHAKDLNPKINILVTATHIAQALTLYEAGADYVIIPHILGGKAIAKRFSQFIGRKKRITEIRNDHLKELLGMEAIYHG